jgi:hypothetical protein
VVDDVDAGSNGLSPLGRRYDSCSPHCTVVERLVHVLDRETPRVWQHVGNDMVETRWKEALQLAEGWERGWKHVEGQAVLGLQPERGYGMEGKDDCQPCCAADQPLVLGHQLEIEAAGVG